MRVPPSGEQVELVRGAARAVVVEVGGGLRSYDVGGVAVVDGFVEDELGALEVDDAFGDLQREPDGLARLLLEAERTVELWMDEGFGWLEVFTGDVVPEPERRRRGLGVEPMTAPPNAFVTGEGVLRLEPGDTVTHRWGVRLRRPAQS